MTEAANRDGTSDPRDPVVDFLAARPPLHLALEPSSPAGAIGSDRTSRDGSNPRGRRGVLVEFVRLIMVALFAASGWELASLAGANRSDHLLIGTLLGSAVGYVLGGVFGRRTATAVSQLEKEFRRIPAAEILAGGIGMILGLVLATLLAFPLYHLPPKGAFPAVAFVYLTLGYVAYKLGRAKSEELFALFGVKPRAAGTLSGEVVILDSSVILDGRLVGMIQKGFLGGTLLVTRGVLDELQSVADSSNAGRRARGRKAMDTLIELKRDPSVDLVLVEDAGGSPSEPVDSQLVRLARARGGTLLTNDNGLGKLATALDIRVRSIHALAEALRPEVVAGQQVPVRLTRRGRDAGQAVGYLDDGTMVVVEEADHFLGDTVTVTVTNALQTSTGRLIFARVAGGAGESGSVDPDPGLEA
jgi:uncharacterized protein YacL